MPTKTKIAELDLAGTKNGKILVYDVKEPYGKSSTEVVSIGVALDGEEAQWKAHVPYENLDELIKVLQDARDAKK